MFKKKNPAAAAACEPPAHIGIIMDGNGRWAKKRGLPRSAGHREGAKNVNKIVRICREAGVKAVSLYAFSTENWRRPQDEVEALFDILRRFLKEEKKTIAENKIVLRSMGDLRKLPADLKDDIEKTSEESASNGGLILNIAINYGGRDEIVHAVNTLIKSGKKEIGEQDVEDTLYTAGLNDPDLIIRTGGQLRLSNFMLWQAAYSEFYFTDVLWPDFGEAELRKAIEDFNGRKRNYGAI